jgi:hypothetical protein
MVRVISDRILPRRRSSSKTGRRGRERRRAGPWFQDEGDGIFGDGNVAAPGRKIPVIGRDRFQGDRVAVEQKPIEGGGMDFSFAGGVSCSERGSTIREESTEKGLRNPVHRSTSIGDVNFSPFMRFLEY